MTRIIEKQAVLWLCLSLIICIAGIYWQVMNFDFVDFDDHKYVPENRMVQKGLTPESIRWAFTSSYASNWFPLTWLSLMLDRHLFGPDAGAFHRTNLLLHIINTLLLFFFLYSCTRVRWACFFVALLFALHPLHVESVAWVTERKDVLSTMFWMLAMIGYVRYCRCRRTKIVWYVLALSAMAFGLTAKPMLVTLPLVLLLLDYWPLGRMNFSIFSRRDIAEAHTLQEEAGPRGLVFLVFEKVPFLILSAASSVLTLIVQKQTRAPITLLSFKERIANALVSYAAYIEKMFWPRNLAAFYPHPGGGLPASKVIIATVILAGISSVVIFFGLKKRFLVTGWLWYLGTLVPVIGLIQVGTQAMADRYTYIPLVGLYIIIAWLICDFFVGHKYSRAIFLVITFMVSVGLMICTYRQARYWRNSTALFERMLKVTSKNYIAHTGLGVTFARAGDIEKAVHHFKAAIKIRPFHFAAHYNLGRALAKQGKLSEAAKCFDKVLTINPEHAGTHNELALILASQGKLDQAVSLYRRGLESNPEYVPLHSNLGVALIGQGKIDEAIIELRIAVQLRPNSETYKNLAVALVYKGAFGKAIKNYTKSINLDPTNAHTYYLLGNAYRAQGRTAEAIAEYSKALELRPKHQRARKALAEAVTEAGQSGQ